MNVTGLTDCLVNIVRVLKYVVHIEFNTFAFSDKIWLLLFAVFLLFFLEIDLLHLSMMSRFSKALPRYDAELPYMLYVHFVTRLIIAKKMPLKDTEQSNGEYIYTNFQKLKNTVLNRAHKSNIEFCLVRDMVVMALKRALVPLSLFGILLTFNIFRNCNC